MQRFAEENVVELDDQKKNVRPLPFPLSPLLLFSKHLEPLILSLVDQATKITKDQFLDHSLDHHHNPLDLCWDLYCHSLVSEALTCMQIETGPNPNPIEELSCVFDRSCNY